MTEPMHKGAMPGVAAEVRCGECEAILGVSNDRTRLILAVATHMEDHHPEVGNLMLDGHHFHLGPAPHRCDLCNVATEPPWWTYVTPPSPGFRCEDPEWLVCEACHEIIQSHPG